MLKQQPQSGFTFNTDLKKKREQSSSQTNIRQLKKTRSSFTNFLYCFAYVIFFFFVISSEKIKVV